LEQSRRLVLGSAHIEARFLRIVAPCLSALLRRQPCRPIQPARWFRKEAHHALYTKGPVDPSGDQPSRVDLRRIGSPRYRPHGMLLLQGNMIGVPLDQQRQEQRNSRRGPRGTLHHESPGNQRDRARGV